MKLLLLFVLAWTYELQNASALLTKEYPDSLVASSRERADNSQHVQADPRDSSGRDKEARDVKDDIEELRKLADEIVEKNPQKTPQQTIDTLRQALDKLSPHHLERRALGDLDDLRETFVQDYDNKFDRLRRAAIFTIASTIWLVFYFVFIYRSDREITVHHWHGVKEPTWDAVNAIPDLVIAFRHPNASHGPFIGTTYHRNSLVQPACRNGLLVPHGILNDAGEALELKDNLDVLADTEAGNVDSTKHDRSNILQSVTMLRSVLDDLIPIGQLRAMFIQDMYQCLLSKGFDTDVFRSINDEMLLMRVALTRSDVQEYYLVRDHTHVQLRRHCYVPLQVDMPLDDAESSPPFLPYNPKLPRELYEMGVLATPKPSEIFAIMKGRAKVFHRVNIITNELSKTYHLSAARDAGLILDWYPVHNEFKIGQLKHTWANFNNLLDLTFVQPIFELRDYFGARIAFKVAWHGLYCKALLAMIPVAFTYIILGATDIMENYLGMSVVVMMWQRIAIDLWQKEETFYVEEFDISSQEQRIREKFRGTLKPSPIDANMKEKESSKALDILRRVVSNFITVCFIMVASLTIYLWSGMKDAIGNGEFTWGASVVVSVWIIVLGKIFQKTVLVLVDFENWKYTPEHYNSLLVKIVVFQCVNYYGSFLYLALKLNESHADKCPKGHCLVLLYPQICITVLCLLVFRILGCLFAVVKVKCRTWYLQWSAQKKEYDGKPSFLEQQSLWDKVTLDYEIEDHAELVLSLGYVLLFGGVFPFLVPLCYATFAVELRLVAFQLVSTSQRPVGEIMVGIGNWKYAVEALQQIGMVTTAFLLATEGTILKDARLLTRVTGIGLFCFLCQVMWYIIDSIIEPVDASTELLRARRQHVLTKIAYLSVGKEAYSVSEKLVKIEPPKDAEAVGGGKWQDLQQICSHR